VRDQEDRFGTRPLTANERAALEASPLTVRRLRHLALQRRSAAGTLSAPLWHGSRGMLRAADSGAELDRLVTDDGWWTLHFPAGGVILQLDPAAPFAAELLRERTVLRVLDGAGAIVLEGQLDADGECEAGWPFQDAPARHFQRHGAMFNVEPQVKK